MLTDNLQRGRPNANSIPLPLCNANPECHKQARKPFCQVQVRRKGIFQRDDGSSQDIKEYQNAIVELMFVLGLVALGARVFITWLLRQNRRLEAQLEAQLEQQKREARVEELEKVRSSTVVVKETELFAQAEFSEERCSSDRLLLEEEAIGHR